MARISDSDELTKLVDSSYKNILDKFNPSARQLISAGKTYLKALQAATNAAKSYVDSLLRLGRHAQQSTWAGASDVGIALVQMVDVYREVHSHQQNLLKAFYVDLLLPLETNLEKDTKVVQSEQKKFLQQHKARQESYAKASAAVKKLRKKARSGRLSATLDKELKLQTLEDERARLDSFCDVSLHSAITQERRRYGFVLERQCSLAKHCLVYHTKGQKFFSQRLEEWERVARSRERLPARIEEMFSTRSQTSVAALRKTKSMDVSCVDLRSLPVTAPLTRAKSDFDLSSSHPSLGPERNLNEGSFQHFSLESGPDWWCGLGDAPARPRSVAVVDEPVCRYRAKALYSYLSSGDHQLSFHEGDLIALIGQRNKGWQYGENLRSHRCGWFPVAYTQQVPVDELDEVSERSPTHYHHQRMFSLDLAGNHQQVSPMVVPERRPMSMVLEGPLSRASSISKGSDRSASSSDKDERRTPPPPPPLPVHTPRPMAVRRVGRSFTSPVPLLMAAAPAVAEVSVHSSNDSGIENESRQIQPRPEVEYSDEEKPS